MTDPLKTLLLTNIAAPYRLPLFEALAERLDLTVYFCERSEPYRRWQPELHSQSVQFVELASRTLKLPRQGLQFVFNPGLTKRLRRARFDVYIAGENFTNAPAVVSVMNMARRRAKPFILWSGAIDTAHSTGHWLSNAYRRWLYRRTDAFVSYGDKAKAFLLHRGAPADRIFSGTQVVAPGWIWRVKADKKALGTKR